MNNYLTEDAINILKEEIENRKIIIRKQINEDLKEARANAYKATEWIDFDNKYMRHDIGKAIDEA